MKGGINISSHAVGAGGKPPREKKDDVISGRF